jgi:hypothetical protein
MKKTLTGFLAIATVAALLAASATDASAQWRGRGPGPGPGWGWRGPGYGWRGPGPGVAAGVLAGALVAGAIIASRPPGYVVYEGYAQPVYAPGCYWASQPLYDRWGNVVGYAGQPVQVCPGYQGPPAPPPGYAGPPPGPRSPVMRTRPAVPLRPAATLPSQTLPARPMRPLTAHSATGPTIRTAELSGQRRTTASVPVAGC